MYHPTRSLIPSRPPLSNGEKSDVHASWRARSQLHVPSVDGGVLEMPFEHASSDYHGTQHGALNAELRYKAERADEGWGEMIHEAVGYIGRVGPRHEAAGSALLSRLSQYREGYCAARLAPSAMADVIGGLGLCVDKSTIEDVRQWAMPDIIAVRRAFTQLQRADALLPPDTMGSVQSVLSPLDSLSGRPMSDCSVALHERHHADVTGALREELQQGADYLGAMDRRAALGADARKEAVEAGEYGRAHDLFLEEVTMRHDLVAINLQRMGLFDDAQQDADAYTVDVDALITAAAEMSAAFRERITALDADLGGDIASLRKAMDDVEARERTRQVSADAEFTKHHDEIMDLNGQEALIWRDIIDRMALLGRVAEERHGVVQKCMRGIEEAGLAKQQLLAEQGGLRAHMDALKGILGATGKATGVGDLFADYSKEMAPILVADCQEVHGTIAELKVAEVTSILRRYDAFTEAAAECTQRTRNRFEGMGRAARQRSLAAETVRETLDPSAAKYEAERIRCDYQLAAMGECLDQLRQLSQDSREAVQPALLYALQTLYAAGDDSLVLKGDAGLITSGMVHRPPMASPKRGLQVAHGDVGVVSVNLITHPQLAAVVKALSLDDFQMTAAAQYVDGEATAVATQRAQLQAAIRRFKEESRPPTNPAVAFE